MLRALADGYDVRGFYYWTLVDNFEWATGFTMKFGLFQWEPDGSVDRCGRLTFGWLGGWFVVVGLWWDVGRTGGCVPGFCCCSCVAPALIRLESQPAIHCSAVHGCSPCAAHEYLRCRIKQ